MILADTIAIFLSVLGVIIATNALWLFDFAVFTRQVEAAGQLFVESPWKSFFLGLVFVAITFLSVGFLSSLGKGPNELVSLIVLSLFFWLSSIGVSGFASRIGDRLEVSGGTKWKSCLFGGLILELTFILPILGWIVLFPVSTITGCGAAARAILKVRKTSKGLDEKASSKETDQSNSLV